jgi:hypothetical protein
MSEQKARKLNQLQRLLPEGLLVDAGWLEGRGYSSPLRSKYLRQGWLEQPARGTYRRPGGRLQWQHVVISLQTLLEFPVFVGGRTALELHGYSHYVSVGDMRELHVYGDAPLPGWVNKLSVDTKFIFHNAKRLFREEPIPRGLTNASWNLDEQTFTSRDPIHGGLTKVTWGQWDWPLALSTPERAILELLDELPENETFHQADKLIEGLHTLSPRRMQKLLEDCRSVKVKRLFLWFAQRHGFRWKSQIREDRVDLGKGKRMLVRGGKLDSRYLITVPEDLHGSA